MPLERREVEPVRRPSLVNVALKISEYSADCYECPGATVTHVGGPTDPHGQDLIARSVAALWTEGRLPPEANRSARVYLAGGMSPRGNRRRTASASVLRRGPS